MPKRIPEEELDAILTVVAAHPESVAVATIRDGLSFELPARMLQRRLALLVQQRRLIAEGRGKGRRYRCPRLVTATGSPVAGSATVTAHGEVYLPLSPEAEAIKHTVRAPIQERQPVGYEREFLDGYRPNQTYYLPAATRQRLLALGRPPDSERPSAATSNDRMCRGPSSTWLAPVSTI